MGALQHLMLSGCATEQNKTPGRHRTICTLTTQSHCLGNPSGRPDADCAERARLRSTKLSVPSRTGSTDSADVAPTAGLVDGIADSLTAAQRVRPASASTKQWRRQGAVCPPQYVVCPLPAELTAASGAARGSSSGNNNLASIKKNDSSQKQALQVNKPLRAAVLHACCGPGPIAGERARWDGYRRRRRLRWCQVASAGPAAAGISLWQALWRTPAQEKAASVSWAMRCSRRRTTAGAQKLA